MALTAGTRLGSYEIVALVGAGGMGEVYRACDPRLGRDVAVKVLPAQFAADDDRLRRFEQEARAVGRLNHPNLLVVHDVGSESGSPYLVSEFLEGETLRACLSSRQLPLTTALDFAVQIVRGLQAAHEKSIVHRDLKPENLFVTTDGRIKILDFGLAKLTTPAAQAVLAATATVGTEPGVVMGTVGYMSPEQVRGDEVDHRSDIFAVGAILHELLTGGRAFTGASSIDVMSAILREEPLDVSASNPAVPPALNRIVRRCLDKRPSARFQTAADLCFSLETLGDSGGTAVPRAPRARSRHWTSLAGWAAAAALAVALIPLAAGRFSGASAVEPARVGSLAAPEGVTPGAFVVAPDGRRVAFTGTQNGMSQLWIRTLNETVVRTLPLEGTTGASNPFWSPDSSSIGFFADNQLKIVPTDGGQPRTLCDVANNRGGTWNRNGVIIFSPDLAGGLYRIDAAGGAKEPLTALDALRQEATHRWPHFLPDGRHFLYFVRSDQIEHTGLYVASLDQPHGRFLGSASSNAIYALPGLLLFVRDGALMAQRFDDATRTLQGTPSALVPQVGYSLPLNRGSFSASADGVLVYGNLERERPVWFDRNGVEQTMEGGVDSHGGHVSLSPDDARMVIERADARTGANDLFVVDLARGGIAARFTSHPGSDYRAVWLTNDRIVWARNRHGAYDLYQKAAIGTGPEELLLSSLDSKVPTDVSPDGRFLVYTSVSNTSRTTLRGLSLTGEVTHFPLLGSEFNEAQARFSPDGRWIAYTTDRDGSVEVYVVEASAVLPGVGQREPPNRPGASLGVRLSSNGGSQPMWRRDMKVAELYYLAADRRLMVITLDDVPKLRPGVARPLFDTRIRNLQPGTQHYAPSRDGQRFIVLTPTTEGPAAVVVFNWTSALGLR